MGDTIIEHDGAEPRDQVWVACDSSIAERQALARSLAERLGLPFAESTAPRGDLLLAVGDDRLEIRDLASPAVGPVYVDFVGGRMGYRRRVAGGQRQLLARAIGFRGAPLTVVDATAGLARDAFLLACLGCDVLAVERSPLLGVLVNDGLMRARQRHLPALDEILLRIEFVVMDARDFLRSLPESQHPEVVYLDPMFPPRSKSAIAAKESRICRRLVGFDEDAAELLRIARQVARRRVVVKRHPHAPPLGALPESPSGHIRGKSVRFDIYQPEC